MTTDRLPFDIDTPVARTFKAGPIELDYENGDIRQLRVGPTEIIRRVYMAVRNHVWDTADCHILDENINETGESFEISYSARYSYSGVTNDFQTTFNCSTMSSPESILIRGTPQCIPVILKNLIAFTFIAIVFFLWKRAGQAACH